MITASFNLSSLKPIPANKQYLIDELLSRPITQQSEDARALRRLCRCSVSLRFPRSANRLSTHVKSVVVSRENEGTQLIARFHFTAQSGKARPVWPLFLGNRRLAATLKKKIECFDEKLLIALIVLEGEQLQLLASGQVRAGHNHAVDPHITYYNGLRELWRRSFYTGVSCPSMERWPFDALPVSRSGIDSWTLSL
jgi:hypothetical protein